ncbi:hypothetical protein RHMOL_Rhmol11G0228900 [Rhododendron molle]|uniref:Uncharacterized protein n=1 Tax=Rhododendron molle TaxID=49168 RepID=A0ACC0LWA6_RHOML|nr:hypothetical protein RHMOL_Rhmol11G0228900 [Rhododendron molle]
MSKIKTNCKHHCRHNHRRLHHSYYRNHRRRLHNQFNVGFTKNTTAAITTATSTTSATITTAASTTDGDGPISATSDLAVTDLQFDDVIVARSRDWSAVAQARPPTKHLYSTKTSQDFPDLASWVEVPMDFQILSNETPNPNLERWKISRFNFNFQATRKEPSFRKPPRSVNFEINLTDLGEVPVSTRHTLFFWSMETVVKYSRIDPLTTSEVVRLEKVWNYTIANITLLAFGTGFPQISLATIDAIRNLGNLYAGVLLFHSCSRFIDLIVKHRDEFCLSAWCKIGNRCLCCCTTCDCHCAYVISRAAEFSIVLEVKIAVV